jgi:drug/metabolite transporter (DMT)-like permease
MVNLMSMRQTHLAYTEALFAVLVWWACFIATKVALQDVSPITVVWLRFWMGMIILGLVVAARRQFALLHRIEWGYFALLFLYPFLPHCCYSFPTAQRPADGASLQPRRWASFDFHYSWEKSSKVL